MVETRKLKKRRLAVMVHGKRVGTLFPASEPGEVPELFVFQKPGRAKAEEKYPFDLWLDILDKRYV